MGWMTEDEKEGGDGSGGREACGRPLMGRGSQNAQATASAPPRAGAIPEPELAFALASAHAREAPAPDLCGAGNRCL